MTCTAGARPRQHALSLQIWARDRALPCPGPRRRDTAGGVMSNLRVPYFECGLGMTFSYDEASISVYSYEITIPVK
eukprot:4928432-Pleurochrysis_carterae.AAC.1